MANEHTDRRWWEPIHDWIVPRGGWAFCLILIGWSYVKYDWSLSGLGLVVGLIVSPLVLIVPFIVFAFPLSAGGDDRLVAPVAFLAAVLSFVAAFGVRADAGSYRLLHLYVTLSSIGLGYRAYRAEHWLLLAMFVVLAVLHVPFIEWGFRRDWWEVINLIAGATFGFIVLDQARGSSHEAAPDDQAVHV